MVTDETVAFSTVAMVKLVLNQTSVGDNANISVDKAVYSTSDVNDSFPFASILYVYPAGHKPGGVPTLGECRINTSAR